jgi:hypothetical protein
MVRIQSKVRCVVGPFSLRGLTFKAKFLGKELIAELKLAEGEGFVSRHQGSNGFGVEFVRSRGRRRWSCGLARGDRDEYLRGGGSKRLSLGKEKLAVKVRERETVYLRTRTRAEGINVNN